MLQYYVIFCQKRHITGVSELLSVCSEFSFHSYIEKLSLFGYQKKLIKMIKSYYISKNMWKAKMEDPILPRRPSAEETKRIKDGENYVKKNNYTNSRTSRYSSG